MKVKIGRPVEAAYSAWLEQDQPSPLPVLERDHGDTPCGVVVEVTYEAGVGYSPNPVTTRARCVRDEEGRWHYAL